MSKYCLELVEDDASWDQFVDDSPQGTVFSLSDYLRLAVAGRYRRYWIRKGNQIKAGLSLVLDESGEACVLDDLVIHNGLMFVDDPVQKETKRRLERFEISEYVIDQLTNKYSKVELALSPQFEDMRPFLWHNYSSQNPQDQFGLDLRYTSYLDISSLSEEQEEESCLLFKGLETLRQRNIREARRDGATYEVRSDSTLFIEYYQSMMDEKGDEQEMEKLQRMKSLIDGMIRLDRAFVLVSKDGSGRPIYSTVFCWDNKRAYYLFGAPNPEAKVRYKGTVAFWDGFHMLVRRDINSVDMEGINSPKRGWFKMSFGGDVRSYYQLYI